VEQFKFWLKSVKVPDSLH